MASFEEWLDEQLASGNANQFNEDPEKQKELEARMVQEVENPTPEVAEPEAPQSDTISFDDFLNQQMGIEAAPKTPEIEEEKGILESVGEAFAERFEEVTDDPWQAFKDSMKPAALGALKAVNETMEFADEVGQALGIADEGEAFQFDTSALQSEKAEGLAGDAQEAAETVSQFVTGFIGAGKVIKTLAGGKKLYQLASQSKRGTAALGAIKGAMADFAAMDDDVGNLSNALETAGYDNFVTDVLAHDPDDPDLLKRTKNAVEGLGIGAAVDLTAKAVIKGVHVWKAAKKAQIQEMSDKIATGDVSDMAPPVREEVDKAPEQIGDLRDRYYELLQEDPAKNAAELKANKDKQKALVKAQEKALKEEAKRSVKEEPWDKSMQSDLFDGMPKAAAISDTTELKQGVIDLEGGFALKPKAPEVWKTIGQLREEVADLEAKKGQREVVEAIDKMHKDSVAESLGNVTRQLAAEEGLENVSKVRELLGVIPGYKQIGKLGESIEAKITQVMGRLASSPSTKMKYMGQWGRVADDMVKRADQNHKMTYGTEMLNHSKAVTAARQAGLTNDELASLPRYLQGLDVPKTKAAEQLVKRTRDMLNRQLDRAVEVGIHSREFVDELKAKGNYWPRIYDHVLLETPQGAKQFAEALSSTSYNIKEVDALLGHLLHGSKDDITEFKKIILKENSGKGGEIIIRPEQLKNMMHRRKTLGMDIQSGHLEKSRGLPDRLDKILNPFLIKDPDAVISHYMNQTTKRIEDVRVFGKQGEAFNLVGRKLEEYAGSEAAYFAKQTYYNHIGDMANSDVLRAQANLNETAKNLLGKVDTLQTFKLSAAQILNAGQVLANAPAYMGASSRMPFVAHFQAIRAMYKAMGKEGRELGARVGAAAEQTILDYAGELSQSHHLLHRSINPRNFLKAVGYLKIEQFNRTFAANLGKAYYEELTDKWALVQAGKIKPDSAKAKKIQRALEELGFNTQQSLKDMSTAEKQLAGERAALAFSDNINFTNNAREMPEMWRHPIAQTFRKFKSFIFHQGKFFKERIAKEAYRGNFTPAINYAASTIAVGLPISEVRRMISGDDSELSDMEKVSRGFTSMGGVGILYDMMTGFTSGDPARVVGTIGGPAASDVYRLAREGNNIKKYLESEGTEGTEPGIALQRQALNVFGTLPGKRKILEDLKEENAERKKWAKEATVEGMMYQMEKRNKASWDKKRKETKKISGFDIGGYPG